MSQRPDTTDLLTCYREALRWIASFTDGEAADRARLALVSTATHHARLTGQVRAVIDLEPEDARLVATSREAAFAAVEG